MSTADNPERLSATGLPAAEDQYRLLIEGVKDYAIFMLDPSGIIVSWNPGAERLKGYSPEQIIGSHFSTFYTKEDVARRKPEWELEVARRDGQLEDEGWRVRRDGSLIWANVLITALRDENGALVGFAKVTRDVTERKRATEAQSVRAAELERANRELDRSRDELRIANDDLEAFAYSVSHDLRAPIRQIDGFSRLLDEKLRSDPDEQARHFLRRIQESACHMGTLVDDLLKLAQVERQGLRPSACSLQTIVHEVLSEMADELAGRDVRVEVAPLPSVMCDRGLIQVALTNVLSNAMKYTRRRSPAIIAVTAAHRDDRVVLCVRDNGVGFDMRYADKLFGVFQRLHRAEDFEGTGVGLATVRRIMRRHGGDATAEAAPDAGASFYLTFGRQAPVLHFDQCGE
jgi:PAS domain S-box-containing protein